MMDPDDFDFPPFGMDDFDDQPAFRKTEEEWIEEWASTFTPTLWKTASGDKMHIEHMGTDHMINSAAFLWRKGMILRVRSPKSPALPLLRSKLKEFLRAIDNRTREPR